MLEIISKNLKIDFVGQGKAKFWLGLSALAVGLSLALVFTKGLNYGIDFTGGAEVQVKFSKQVVISDLRSILEGGGFKNAVIQQLGEATENEYLMKFGGDESDLQDVVIKIKSVLDEKVSKNDFDIERVDVVGPQAGRELRRSGFLSMFYALLCILIYVGIRFDYRYGPGAVLALFHDASLTLGIFALTQREFSLQIVAAILTIIGYSNNDTIIVYDRIRETLKLHPNRSLEQNINLSINETLSRTLLTSLLTLLVVTALMFFGAGTIKDFAFTLFVGILIGTYSSIFIASPILLMVSRWQENRETKLVHKAPIVSRV